MPIHKVRRPGRMFMMAAGYAIFYLAGSSMDLVSTRFALLRPGAGEANIFATSGGTYDDLKAWLTTLVAGALLTALYVFGVRNARRMSARWLEHPIRSFLSIHAIVLNPWSRRAADRTPLYAISFAVAFPILRILAALNNVIIIAGGSGPIGLAVLAVTRATTPAVGLLTVTGTLYIGIAVALAPWSARFLVAERGRQERSKADI